MPVILHEWLALLTPFHTPVHGHSSLEFLPLIRSVPSVLSFCSFYSTELKTFRYTYLTVDPVDGRNP